MSALIRPRQRAITAVSPHNANRRYIVPKRDKSDVEPLPFAPPPEPEEEVEP